MLLEDVHIIDEALAPQQKTSAVRKQTKGLNYREDRLFTMDGGRIQNMGVVAMV